MSWFKTELTKKIGIKYPIIQAPMAGGPTTVELVLEVAKAGGLGSLGAGLLEPKEIEEKILSIRSQTSKPYNVNLFIPSPFNRDLSKKDKINQIMEPYRKELKLTNPSLPKHLLPSFEKQVEVLLDYKVPVFSFTFGCLEANLIKKFQSNGSCVIGTATTSEEALALQKKGVDFVVAQGYESGGHRGTFLHKEEHALIGSMVLIPSIASATKTPVIGAGGIMNGKGVLASLILGACGVQMGTAFLCSEESGIIDEYKNKIINSSSEKTVLTRAFSGKLARGIANRFTKEMESFKDVFPDFPLQNTLTRDIRKKAGEIKNLNFMSLWAGQGCSLGRKVPAKEIIRTIVEEINQTIAKKDF